MRPAIASEKGHRFPQASAEMHDGRPCEGSLGAARERGTPTVVMCMSPCIWMQPFHEKLRHAHRLLMPLQYV